MRVTPIFLCWLICATCYVANADIAPTSLADYTAPGGYSIHLSDIGPFAHDDQSLYGIITNSGSMTLTGRINVTYLNLSGQQVAQHAFYIVNLAISASQKFSVECPSYWVTYTMTIYPGEQQGAPPQTQIITTPSLAPQPSVTLTADQLKAADKATSDYWSNYWQNYYRRYYLVLYNQQMQAVHTDGIAAGAWAAQNGY